MGLPMRHLPLCTNLLLKILSKDFEDPYLANVSSFDDGGILRILIMINHFFIVDEAL